MGVNIPTPTKERYEVLPGFLEGRRRVARSVDQNQGFGRSRIKCLGQRHGGFRQRERNAQDRRIGAQLFGGGDAVVVYREQAHRTPGREAARDSEFYQGGGLSRAATPDHGGD